MDNMKAKLETLPLSELREIARSMGLRRITGIKKADLIENMIAAAPEAEARPAAEDAKPEKPASKGQRRGRPRAAGKAGKSAKETGTDDAAPADEAGGVSGETAQVSDESGSISGETARVSDEAGQPAGEAQAEDSASGEKVSAEGKRRQPAKGRGRGRTVQTRMHNGRKDQQGNARERTKERSDRSERGETAAGGQTRVKERPDPGQTAPGEPANGILEIMADGYGFIRSNNFLPGDGDVYVSPSQIRRFNMRTGDEIAGIKRLRSGNEKFAALLYVNTINGCDAESMSRRPNFEDLTPVFPDERIHLETPGCPVSMRVMDLMSPIGKGQRGMIVSPPKAGKTTILKQIARAVQYNYPEMYMIILLIDERPEEVTDFRESIHGDQVQVVYSTFDELPEHHRRVTEMVMDRAKRLVESGKDVIILLDSITRLSRACNLTVTPSGRTLSGGLDPAALYMPKKFFGAARNLREGGSLTILATALVDTGSRMDDMVFEEFKGTGNMELALDRKLSERRIFPAIDILKSGTRRDDLLLTNIEQKAIDKIHRVTNGMKPENAIEQMLEFFLRTKDNEELFRMVANIVL